MLIQRGRPTRSGRRPNAARALATMAVASLVIGPVLAATAQDLSPREIRESVKPVDAMPQLRLSLQLLVRAQDLVTSQPTKEASAEAADLCRAAYRLQRGAQQGLGTDKIKRRSPMASETHKHISASRQALLDCSTRFSVFGTVRMQKGLASLQTAVAQTRVAVTLAE